MINVFLFPTSSSANIECINIYLHIAMCLVTNKMLNEKAKYAAFNKN